MSNRLKSCPKYLQGLRLGFTAVSLLISAALVAEISAQASPMVRKAQSMLNITAELTVDGEKKYQVSFTGELVPAVIVSFQSIVEMFYPMSSVLADELLLLDDIEGFPNLSHAQLAEVRRLRDGLELPVEAAEEIRQGGHLSPRQKQAVMEADQGTVEELVDVLDSRQLKELQRLSAIRHLRLFGMAEWLDSREKSQELSRSFRLWLQTVQPEIQERFQECRRECLQSLLDLEDAGGNDALVQIVNTEWITNDLWLFGTQLRSDMETRKVETLIDFLEVGNPNCHLALSGNMVFRISATGSRLAFFEQLVTHRAYGGIEVMQDQMDEIRSQLFYMPPGEEEKLQQKMSELRENALTTTPEEVQNELRELNLELERRIFERLEQILVPVQKEMIRQVLLRRLVNAYGPWLVLTQIEAPEIPQDKKLKLQIQQSREQALKCFEKFENEMFDELWDRAKSEFPELGEQLVSAGIAKSGLKPGDGIWLFRNIRAN